MATLTQAELDDLLDSKAKLNALEGAGVDNWEGYDIALDEYQKHREKIEKANSVAEKVIELLSGSIYEPSEHGAGFAFRDDAIEEVYAIIRKFGS